MWEVKGLSTCLVLRRLVASATLICGAAWKLGAAQGQEASPEVSSPPTWPRSVDEAYVLPRMANAMATPRLMSAWINTRIWAVLPVGIGSDDNLAIGPGPGLEVDIGLRIRRWAIPYLMYEFQHLPKSDSLPIAFTSRFHQLCLGARAVYNSVQSKRINLFLELALGINFSSYASGGVNEGSVDFVYRWVTGLEFRVTSRFGISISGRFGSVDIQQPNILLSPGLWTKIIPPGSGGLALGGSLDL